jgi:hypothetical protein
MNNQHDEDRDRVNAAADARIGEIKKAQAGVKEGAQ